MILTKCNYEGKKSTYPMLKYIKTDKYLTIGLFEDSENYTVVSTTLPSIWELGRHLNTAGKPNLWEEYDGTVTLSND